MVLLTLGNGGNGSGRLQNWGANAIRLHDEVEVVAVVSKHFNFSSLNADAFIFIFIYGGG